MEEEIKNRRSLSQTGLLDSAVRSITKLTASSDAQTRSLANQAMGDLMRLRHTFPTRRESDTITIKGRKP